MFIDMHTVILLLITFEVDEVSLNKTGNSTGFVASWKEFLFPLKSANLFGPNMHACTHICVAGSCFTHTAMALLYIITLC